MQTLVYIIGGYCLIKAVLVEIPLMAATFSPGKPDLDKVFKTSGTTALLFLSAIEAFNQ